MENSADSENYYFGFCLRAVYYLLQCCLPGVVYEELVLLLTSCISRLTNRFFLCLFVCLFVCFFFVLFCLFDAFCNTKVKLSDMHHSVTISVVYLFFKAFFFLHIPKCLNMHCQLNQNMVDLNDSQFVVKHVAT